MLYFPKNSFLFASVVSLPSTKQDTDGVTSVQQHEEAANLVNFSCSVKFKGLFGGVVWGLRVKNLLLFSYLP